MTTVPVPARLFSDSTIKVRDFGFAATDARHYGPPDSASHIAHAHLFPMSAASKRLSKLVNTRPPELLFDARPETHEFLGLSVGGEGGEGEGEDEEDDDEDEDDDDDDDDNNTLAPTLASFPFLVDHLSRLLNRPVRRAKAQFDFAKGSDCEMDLRERDIVLLLVPTPSDSDSATNTQKQKDSSSSSGGGGGASAGKQVDRFASIEELSPTSPSPIPTPASLLLLLQEQQQQIPIKTASYLSLSPPPSELILHLSDFLRMQDEYGTGWVVALKFACKDVGGRALSLDSPDDEDLIQAGRVEGVNGGLPKTVRVIHRFKMRLTDIGLVPNSYVS
ncbi:hypothetical protein HDU99_001209 [Rhizoclosmatium hyalinum]|nr:hypothetical protein HDU99_001209 [Rhizoclosmatium hyalinum]